MFENIRKRIPLLRISSWYILMLCAFTTVLTFHFLSMYGTVHWPILNASYDLKSHIERISKDEKANRILKENDNLRRLFDDLPGISEKIHKAGWKLMRDTAWYHISGLLSFILAVFTFFCRPRCVGILALPFGLYSFYLAGIIM